MHHLALVGEHRKVERKEVGRMLQVAVRVVDESRTSFCAKNESESS